MITELDQYLDPKKDYTTYYIKKDYGYAKWNNNDIFKDYEESMKI